MATVRVKGWGGGKEYCESVESYIAESTESYTYENRGIAEEAAAQVDNVAHTLGRLVETLVDKGVLDKDDLVRIVGPDAPTVIRLRRNSNAEKV